MPEKFINYLGKFKVDYGNFLGCETIAQRKMFDEKKPEVKIS
jgi:hypothetical protein